MAVSIYIVEDELWIRKGIKKMIHWQALDAVLVGEAEDGAAAYEEIKRLRPQIVLSDIRIPKKDGLAVVRQAMEEYSLKAIFISGYRDFDYVRQALNLDAVSYILKPVDEQELNRVIGQAIEKIKQEELHSKAADYGKESYLLNILDDRIEDMEGLLVTEKKEEAFCVLLIPRKQLNVPVKTFKNLLKECLGGTLKGDFFQKSKDEYVVIFSSESAFNFERRVLNVSEKLQKITQCTGFWALGDSVYTLAEIPLSYNHAWMAFLNRDVHPSAHLLKSSPKDRADVVLPSAERMESLRLAVETGSQEKIDCEMKEIMKALTKKEKIGMKGVSDCIFYMCMDIIRLLQKNGISTGKYYERCQTFSDNRLVFQDAAEIFAWFYGLLTEMAEDVCQSRMKSAGLAVLKVKNYIDLHYTESISLNEMAEMAYINPNYLSTSFKKLTGIGFSDYIIEKRMRKAAKILKETKLGIAEVAVMSGYENIRHFSRLFRKYYGQTPTEFREEHGNASK